MLAPRELPDEFLAWNQRHKAPSGPFWWHRYVLESRLGRWSRLYQNRMRIPAWLTRRLGPFAFQLNSWTRSFEYPWCYHITELRPGMRVVELGAGISGLQFVLAEAGLDVVAVDPLVPPEDLGTQRADWLFSIDEYQRLNRAFGGKVQFICDHLENAGIPSVSVDRVFSVSVIEHIPPGSIGPLVQHVARILKPGGRFIATVDLFLDCVPFSHRSANKFGTNVSVRSMIAESGLRLQFGDPSHLLGFDEFDPERIREQLDRFLNVHGVLTQCIVLEKPGVEPGQGPGVLPS